MPNRRQFMMQVSLGSGVLVAGSAMAQAPLVNEADGQAAALGYKADASKVDKAKFPKFAAGQICGNCVLFQGKATDVSGVCPLFSGKLVAGKGWCNSYVKKG
ncbi:MAG: iron permease [Rhodoferax sp.]|nr:iron permease [Rhodoferax sp.]